MNFGIALKAFRKQQKLSLDGLATKLDVSRGTIVNWENQVSSPSFETCKALHSMGMNFISLLKSEEDINLDKKDAENLALKLTSIIEEELNRRVYGVNLLDKLNDTNRTKLNFIIEHLLKLDSTHQEAFLGQTIDDLDAFSRLSDKYSIESKHMK